MQKSCQAQTENGPNLWVGIVVPWFHHAAMFCETCCINNGAQAGAAFRLQLHDVFPADAFRQNVRMYLGMVCENGKAHRYIHGYGLVHAVIVAKGNTLK